MENYTIRGKDCIPIKGYYNYIDRNYDTLIKGKNESDLVKTAGKAVALCFAHFGGLTSLIVSGIIHFGK